MMQILNILIGLLLVLTTNTLNLAEQQQHRLPLEPTDHSAPITALLNTTNTLKVAESSRSIEIVAAAFAIGDVGYNLLKGMINSIKVDTCATFQISNEISAYTDGFVQLVQGTVAHAPDGVGTFPTTLEQNKMFTYKVDVGDFTGTRGAGSFKIDKSWFFFMWSIPNTGWMIAHHVSVAIGGCEEGSKVKWKEDAEKKPCGSIRSKEMGSNTQTDGLYSAMKTTNLDKGAGNGVWFRRATYNTYKKKWVYTHYKKGASNGEDIGTLPDVQVKVGGNKWIQLTLPGNDQKPLFLVNVHRDGQESIGKRIWRKIFG